MAFTDWSATLLSLETRSNDVIYAIVRFVNGVTNAMSNQEFQTTQPSSSWLSTQIQNAIVALDSGAMYLATVQPGPFAVSAPVAPTPPPVPTPPTPAQLAAQAAQAAISAASAQFQQDTLLQNLVSAGYLSATDPTVASTITAAQTRLGAGAAQSATPASPASPAPAQG